MCPSALTYSPLRRLVTSAPRRSMCPENSWPWISGTLMRFWAHASQS